MQVESSGVPRVPVSVPVPVPLPIPVPVPVAEHLAACRTALYK